MQFVTTSWYWDMDDASRKFADAFLKKTNRRPTEIQAADYSATMMNYPQGRRRQATVDADKVMATWRGMKMDDFFARARSVPMAATCTTCTWCRSERPTIQGPLGLLQDRQRRPGPGDQIVAPPRPTP